DGMKTIARPSPAFPGANANAARPSAPLPAPGKPPQPGAAFGSRPPMGNGARPAPALPSKLAPPRTSGPPSAAGGPPSQSPFSTKPAPKGPPPGAGRSGLAQTM